MTLDVAISTCGRDGIKKVANMLLPPQEGVMYVVSWQDHEGTPLPETVTSRDDVTVSRLDVKGLSNNRNNSIRHCTSDIVLIADDDLVYDADGFRRVLKAFIDYPDLDLATFRVNFPHEKDYPADGTRLGMPLPKGYYVTSMEIAFRRKRLEGLRFNPGMGLGAPRYHCGEEEIFLHDAICRGFDCRHIGETICSHPQPTTGTKISPGILMGHAYVIRRLYGFSTLPRLVVKARRVSRQFPGVSFTTALWHLLRGAAGKP